MSPFLRPVATTVVIVAVTVVLGASQHEGSADDPSQAVPVNSVCVFSKSPVRAHPPTANYSGYTVRFCCSGCEKLWESLSEPEKDEALGKFFPGRTPGSPVAADGLGIARAYLSGLNTGQLDALDRLFLPEGRSSIL